MSVDPDPDPCTVDIEMWRKAHNQHLVRAISEGQKIADPILVDLARQIQENPLRDLHFSVSRTFFNNNPVMLGEVVDIIRRRFEGAQIKHDYTQLPVGRGYIIRLPSKWRDQCISHHTRTECENQKESDLE